MNNLIQWPRAQYWDKPWNPWIGCKPCSPACENCYAATLARRFKMSFEPHETNQKPPRSGVVFCGNMTDIFGHWMYAGGSAGVVARTLGYSRQATYLWLTKRPGRMTAALECGKLLYKDETGEHESPFSDCEFGNQYFGITAENQLCYDVRIRELVKYAPSWGKYWISAEPLLGSINLHIDLILQRDIPFCWVVVGCESGPKRRPCKIEWIEDIVKQCRNRNIPVFVKQLDLDGKCVTDITKFPKNLQIRQVPWRTN